MSKTLRPYLEDIENLALIKRGNVFMMCAA